MNINEIIRKTDFFYKLASAENSAIVNNIKNYCDSIDQQMFVAGAVMKYLDYKLNLIRDFEKEEFNNFYNRYKRKLDDEEKERCLSFGMNLINNLEVESSDSTTNSKAINSFYDLRSFVTPKLIQRGER